MSAIQVPDAQQDEIDTVLSVMQLSVAQAVQVGCATALISSCVVPHKFESCVMRCYVAKHKGSITMPRDSGSCLAPPFERQT